MLALLAPLSVLVSELPATLAWPLALLAGICGVRSMRAYAASPGHELTVPRTGGQLFLDGSPITDLRLRWRGPLLFIDWKPGSSTRRQRLVFWPDVLDAAARRELRLAVRRQQATSDRTSVAG